MVHGPEKLFIDIFRIDNMQSLDFGSRTSKHDLCKTTMDSVQIFFKKMESRR